MITSEETLHSLQDPTAAQQNRPAESSGPGVGQLAVAREFLADEVKVHVFCRSNFQDEDRG